MAKRTTKPPQPELTADSGAPESLRNADGTWKKGGPSPCPGGRALAATRFARTIKEMDAEGDGKELVRFAWSVMRGDVKVPTEVPTKEGIVSLMVLPTVRERLEALKWLRENGWGKSLPASEMVDPDEIPEPETPEASPHGLVSQSQRMLARMLASLDAQVRAGLIPSEQFAGSFVDAVRALSDINREERELAKQGAAAGLADAELISAVLANLPVEKLREALTAREKEAA